MNKATLLLAMAVLAASATIALPQASAAILLTYQEGVDGYAGTQDTWFTNNDLTTDVTNGNEEFVQVNRRGGGGNQRYALLRFDDIFGAGLGQINPSTDPADIISATLSLQFFTVDTGNQGLSVNRLTALDWDESDSNNTLWANGAPATTQTISQTIVTTGLYNFDVTDHIKAWLADSDPQASNRGWLVWETIQNSGGISEFRSSEYTTDTALRPILEVTIVPEPATVALMGLGGLLMLARSRRPHTA